MLPPWLRQLKKRFVGHGATAPIRTSLSMESLEERDVPATFFWTGLAIADAGGQLVTVDGNGNRFDNTRWSFARNWSSADSAFGVPQPNDDVVFPDGLPANQQPPSTGQGPTFVWGTNSSIDINPVNGQPFQVRNFTVLGDNYRIDAFAGDSFNPRPTTPIDRTLLTITGEIRSRIPDQVGPNTGLSLVGGLTSNTSQLSITLTGENQSLRADETAPGSGVAAPGVLKFGVPFVEPVDGSPFDTDPTVGSVQLVGLNKTGLGTIATAGASNFRGQVTVGQGTLATLHSSALGTSLNGTDVATGATVGVGQIDVGTYRESFVIRGVGTAALPGAANGGAAPAGTLLGSLAGLSDPAINFSGGAIGDSGPATIDGNVNMASAASIGTWGVGITINGQLTGGGTSATTPALTKVGTSGAARIPLVPISGLPAGQLALTNKNAYTGQTLINGGSIIITNNDALSSSPTVSTTTVAAGAALGIAGNITVPENLILNGTGALDLNGNALGALRLFLPGSQATVTGSITLASSASIGVANSQSVAVISDTMLTLTGQITSAAGVEFNKVDAGIVRIPVANPSLRGPINVRNGFLRLADPNAIGPANAGAVTVGNGGVMLGNVQGTLQLEGTYTFAKAIALNGQGALTDSALRVFENPVGLPSNITLTGPVSLGAATSVRVDPSSSLTVNSVISGPLATSNLDKFGAGVLTLAGTNSYQGVTTIREGTAVVTNARSLGGINGLGTVVASGATLRLPNPLNVTGEQLTLSGVGVGGNGAFQVPAGTTTWTGGVVLNGVNTTEADINVAAGGVLNFSGVLSGDADLRKIGQGELRLTGNSPNQFVKTTFLDTGTIALGKNPAVGQALGGPTGGAIIIGDGIGVGPNTNNVDVLRLDAPNQIPNVQSIIIRETGLFDLNGNRETLGGLTAVSLRGGEINTGATGVLTLGGNLTTAGSGEQSVINGTIDLGGVTRSFNFAATPLSRLTTSKVTSAAGETVTFTFDADANPMLGEPSGFVVFVDKFTAPDGTVVTNRLTPPQGVQLDVNGRASINVNTLVAGSHEITAQYSGDTAYPPVQVTLNEVQKVVNPQQQELLSISANPAMPNQPFTLTYTLKGPNQTIAPTGTVRFIATNNTTGAVSDLTANLGLPAGVPLNAAGQAVLVQTLGLDTGRYTITAVYSGDGSYSPSTTSLAPVLAVGAIPTVTSAATVPQNDPDFAANTAVSASSLLLGDRVRFTFRAVGSSGVPTGSVRFFDTFTNVNGVTTITELTSLPITNPPPGFIPGVLDSTGSTFIDVVFGLGTAGEHIITAEYGGDTTYTPNTATLSPSLVVSNPLSVNILSGPNPVLQNRQATYIFRATGRPGQPLPTGTVTFFNTVNGVRSPVAFGQLVTRSPTSNPPSYDGSTYAEATGIQVVGTVNPLIISADFTSGDNNYSSQTNIQSLVPPNRVEPVATFNTSILFQASRNAVEPFESFSLTVSSATAFGRVRFFLNGNLIGAPLAPAADAATNQGLGFPLNIIGPPDASILPTQRVATINITGLPPAPAGTYNFTYDFVPTNGSPIGQRLGVRLQPDLQVIAPVGGILQASNNPARENTPITLTYTTVVKQPGVAGPNNSATSRPPTGSIIFRDGGVVLRDATGNASIPLIVSPDGLTAQAVLVLPGGLPAGTRNLTATYGGDTFYRNLGNTIDPTPDPANPPDLRLVVFGGNQVQISLTSDANSALLGQNVTFTFAAPGNTNQPPASGTVQFFSQPLNSTVRTPIGVPQVLAGGVATVMARTVTPLQPNGLQVGVFRITADYSGDTNYAATTVTLTPNQRIVNPPFSQISADAPLDPTTGGAVQSAATPITFNFSSRKNVLPNVNTPLATGDVQFFAAPIVGGVVGTPVLIGTSTLAPSATEPTVNAVASFTAPGFASPGEYVITARYTAQTTVGAVTTTDPNYEPIDVILSPNLVIVPAGAPVPDPTPDATIKPVQQPLARLNGSITGTAPAGQAPPGIVKAGVGTFTINGVSGYTGPTVQNSMTGSSIVLLVSGALPNTPLVITSGTVDINGTTQTVSTLSDNTALGGSSTAGNLAFTGGGTLNVGSTAASVTTTYAGVMTGTGVVNKNGASTLSLTGNSGAFNGTIRVNSGTLRVNNAGATQPGNYAGTTITVPATDATMGIVGGGTFGGTGTVGSLSLGSGTFVAPGAGTGTAGTLTATSLGLGGTDAAPSTFQIDLIRVAAAGTVTGDLLTVTTLGMGAINPILALGIGGYNNPMTSDNVVNIFRVTSGLPADFRFRRPDGSVIENNATVAVNGQAFRISYGATTVTAQYAGLDVIGTLSGAPAGPVSQGAAVTYTLDLPSGVGGTVTFTVTPAGGATPSTQTVTVNGAGDATTTTPITFTANGSYTVTASYSGNATIAQKDFRLTQLVNFATTMSLTSSSASSAAGSPVTFTAAVSSANGTPTGTVTFTNLNTGEVLGSAALAGGIASITTTAVATGTNTIRATYSGDGNFRANTADVLQTVSGGGQAAGAFYTNAVVIGNLLVVQGNGVPGGIAVIPVPPGTVALFTDINGDGNGDIILLLPNLAVVFDGATGRLLFLFSDSDGDGRRELIAFAPDGTATRVA